MIVITGARGFIGSNLVEKLNNEDYTQLILVDELKNPAKSKHLKHAKYEQVIDRKDFLPWFVENFAKIKFVFHLGARTDTTEQDETLLNKLNLNYSKEVFKICAKHQIPLVYASSAATYGDGKRGYSDEVSIQHLRPLNPYGWSKQKFDLWVSEQKITPPFWAGLKFFNVYGKHEDHKNRMASVVFHAYRQIKSSGRMQLFMSHKEEYNHGEQSRDFIAVQDVCNICYHFLQNQKGNGLYNVGTGEARSFNDLVKAVFKAMNIPENIDYIPTPEDIRDAYQYYTQADMTKMRKQGYTKAFLSLEEGVKLYIRDYLDQHS